MFSLSLQLQIGDKTFACLSEYRYKLVEGEKRAGRGGGGGGEEMAVSEVPKVAGTRRN